MKGSSVLKGFVVLLTAVFIIHQLISSLYSPIKTESAVYHTSMDGLNITGVIIRNELLVSYDGVGVMHFVVADGNRVAKNGVIADIYDSESASVAVSEYQLIKKKIKDIEDILSYNDIEAANLDLINARVNERVDELIYSASTGNFVNVKQASTELISAINRKQAAMGVTGNLSAELEALKALLPTGLTNPKGQILAKESGYFVSQTDGYESVLTSNDLNAITPEFLADIKPQKTESNVTGKIVSDYEWYIAAEVSISESMEFKEGESLKLKTSVKTSPTLPVTVKKINISQSGEGAVIIFACNQMNSELASMRTGPMTVVKSEYSGLKVPRKALRVVDSVRGVYVLTGMQVEFVPVEILYSNDSFLICEKQTESSEHPEVLKLYDRVVVKGKNLYDGKIVS